jgi:hypothetical protein
MNFDLKRYLVENKLTPGSRVTNKQIISKQQAKEIGDRLNVNWDKVNLDEFTQGINVEMEHVDITKGNLIITAKIALVHLKELPDYYTRLNKMEKGK